MKLLQTRIRKRRWWAAGGLAGALVVAGVVSHSPSDDDAHVPVHVTTHVSPRPTFSPPAVAGSLELAPWFPLSDLMWEDYHGMELPRSAADGPRRAAAGLASGFARTPRGALLAAVHIVTRAAPQWGLGVLGPTIDQQVTGTDRTALAKTTRTAYERLRRRAGTNGASSLGRAYSVIEGFRWQGYTADIATLDVLSAGPGDDDLTVRAATRVEVQWRGGDWRVVAPLGGDWANSASRVGSTAGYTLFPPGEVAPDAVRSPR